MKNLAIVFLFTCLGLTSIAQIEKGKIMIGGGFNFNNQIDRVVDTLGRVTQLEADTYLNLNIRAGYFISTNFLCGLTFGLGNSVYREETSNFFISTTNKQKSSNINSYNSFGIFARLYRKLGSSKLLIFGQGGLSYQVGKFRSDNEFVSGGSLPVTSKYTGDNNTIRLLLQPGVAYFISSRVAVETYFGNFGYSSTTQKYYNKDGKLTQESTTAAFSGGLQFNFASIFLGVSFYLGGNNKDKTAVSPATE